jgi:hypothetical protein
MDTAGRDLGLRRLSHLTRWTVGGAVVLAGVFSALVAHVRPGHSKAAPAATPPTVAQSGNPSLQPPAQPPNRGGGGGGLVTSGAS